MPCFNPDNKSFSKDANSEIYVDKTGLIEKLNRVINSSANCIAVSHARRFGKSQAAGMIDAYYSKGSDSRELFSKFEIAKSPDFEKHLNKYNVLHLDMAEVCDGCGGDIMGETYRRIIKDFKIELNDKIDYSQPIDSMLSDIYKLTGSPFVIIIDEWDCVVRNYADKPDMVHSYMQFLHSLFKSEGSKSFLALGYITGILPIKKIKDESALNNFREYTMIDSDRLTPYFGFTENEVEELCKKYDMNSEAVKAWYNGYLINGQHMYNPNSVCEAMDRHRLDSFWKNTSSFDSINDLIEKNYDGLRDDIIKILGGEELRVNTLTFRNDLSDIRSKDDVFTALIHLGYLGYNAKNKTAILPNYEVATAYEAALKSDQWGKIAQTIRQCDALLQATITKNSEKVAAILDAAHSAYTSILNYNDENSLSCAITMAYFTAPQYYTIARELPSGKGFADLSFIPLPNSGKPPMIVELKWDKNADSAIKQIKERRYTDALKDFVNKCNGAEILLVGVNYSKRSKTKKHTCTIESFTQTAG
ncbi:MAG: AAA family ATPase [Synergistes sp.]|nr:AAA family ATPase [Synergistes sp.]